MNGPDRRQIDGEAILFGFPSTTARLSVRARPTAWRASGAAGIMGAGVVASGVVAFIPPHAPWIIGALVGSSVMARRRWIERFTLESVEATCPKCGAPLVVKASRLRAPHPVACEGCHHESSLKFDAAALRA